MEGFQMIGMNLTGSHRLGRVRMLWIRGCDRAIPNPNRLVKSFAYKINCLLKNIVWLYKPSSHANVLDAGP